MDAPLWGVAAAAFGLSIGSFLTAYVPRFERGESALAGRSYCPACRKKLSWYELVPLVSFVLQGGGCRGCGHAIPVSYAVVEGLAAAAFVGIWLALARGWAPVPPFAGLIGGGRGFELLVAWAYYGGVAALLIAVAWYDVRTRLIPLGFSGSLAALGALAALGNAAAERDVSLLLQTAGAAAASFAFFWLLWFASKGRAMGRGDADLAAGIALAFGPLTGAIGILFAFWLGAGYGILAVLFGARGWRSEMPFAPFLAAGSLAAFVSSEAFISILLYDWL